MIRVVFVEYPVKSVFTVACKLFEGTENSGVEIQNLVYCTLPSPFCGMPYDLEKALRILKIQKFNLMSKKEMLSIKLDF